MHPSVLPAVLATFFALLTHASGCDDTGDDASSSAATGGDERASTGTADVEIREDHWVWEGHTLVLWFHRKDGAWRVLETVHFMEDVEF